MAITKCNVTIDFVSITFYMMANIQRLAVNFPIKKIIYATFEYISHLL